MLTPIVTEISRIAEPVVRDTFISDSDLRSPHAQPASPNVVALASRRARRRRPVSAPLRAA